MDKKRILFIEDEPDQVTLIKTRLEANDFEFSSALDGEEGLKKAHEEKPDLVLLDILLPGIHGFEVCKRLRQDRVTKHIPIVVLTASGTKHLEEQCRQAGADILVRKPYDSADLVAKIKNLLGQQ